MATLRFPSRGRLVIDPDGGQRIVLDARTSELEPPNAEEHAVPIAVDAGATSCPAGPNSTPATQRSAAQRSAAQPSAAQCAPGGAAASGGGSSGARLFEDGFEFVHLTHPTVAETLSQLSSHGRLSGGRRSGGMGGMEDIASDLTNDLDEPVLTTLVRHSARPPSP